MAEDPTKEKNMQNISANIYCGLQKWVNRASISLRGRQHTRRTRYSDVSNMTLYKKNVMENLGQQGKTEQRVVPVHGRSRSSPVMMPETLRFDGDVYQKIAKVPTTSKHTANTALLARKQSCEVSDDSSSQGSFKEKNMSVLNSRLTQNLSKSESCLTADSTGSYYRSLRSKSQTAPNSSNRRRKSSDTDGSFDSYSSEIDINDNRKARSSRSRSRTNKQDRGHLKDSAKVDLIGTNKTELSAELKAKEIHSRLDRWIEKSSAFQDSKQSSFESTSSSDETFYIDPARMNETQHIRDLQSAIQELVSSCGQHSPMTRNGNTNETKTKRKMSLDETGSLFTKTISEIDSSQNDQTGFSNENDASKIIHQDEGMRTLYQQGDMTEISSISDVVDGFKEIRDMNRERESSKTDNQGFVNDIGPDSDSSRASNIPPNHGTLHSLSLHQNTNTLHGRNSDLGSDEDLQDTVSRSKPNTIISSSNKPRLTNPVPVSVKKLSLDSNTLHTSTKFYKNSQNPPRKRAGEKTSQVNAKLPAFGDASLTEFALECMQHAHKKKTSIKNNERESKSDSDEEKRAIDHEFVYLPRNSQSEAPKSTFQERALSRGALSDDDIICNSASSQIRAKGNSADSLNGYVIFDDSVSIKDIDSEENKSHSSNENENSKGPDKTDYSGNNLKKFPSMPLFYVPKEFDGSSETKQVRSLGKSLWKRIKSLPRSNENHRTAQPSQKIKEAQNGSRVDPFYHGNEKENDAENSRMRTKSHSVGSRKAVRRRRRLSLSGERDTKPSIKVTQPSEDRVSGDEQTQCASMRPRPAESQC